MSKDLTISVLMDFYGDLLTEKQRDTLDLYYNKDYFFNFVLDLGIISDNTETYATEIENKLIDNNVSINDINAIDEILEEY